MGKNNIRQYDERALVDYIAKLRKQTAQLKAQQPSTLQMTALRTASFTLEQFVRAENQDGDSTAQVYLALTPPNNEVMFAIPEFDLYADRLDEGWPAVNNDFNLWPEGGAWVSMGQGPVWFDMDWWYDTFSSNSNNIVAVVNIRARNAFSNYKVVFVSRWRYITPGSD